MRLTMIALLLLAGCGGGSPSAVEAPDQRESDALNDAAEMLDDLDAGGGKPDVPKDPENRPAGATRPE